MVEVQKLTQNQKTILALFDEFHRPEYLKIDPLIVVRRFENHRHQEFVALLSALFAFGGVKQIIASVENVVMRMGLEERGESLWSARDLLPWLSGFKHRIYVDRDVVMLALLYQQSVKRFGSLEDHFRAHHSAEAKTVGVGLMGVIKDYREWALAFDFKPGAHFKHMLNSPEDGSTCKRWLMLLKWYIRPNDGIDLGLWKTDELVRTDQLLIPLDTHLFRISKRLRLTHKKTANWKTAVEVTENLKKLDPCDPTKYDFALCRLGMFEYRQNQRNKSKLS